MTNQLIVMGGGMHVPAEGAPYLNHGSIVRADCAAAYFYDNFTRFISNEARIVCAGGYPPLPEGVPIPDLDHREGTLIANYLMKEGVPHRVIEVERNSTSTFTNLAFSMDEGYISPATAVAERPLGIVSHPGHVKRAALCAAKLGFRQSGLELIQTRERDNMPIEAIWRTVYKGLFLGAADPQAMLKRDRLAERTMDGVRRKLHRL